MSSASRPAARRRHLAVILLLAILAVYGYAWLQIHPHPVSGFAVRDRSISPGEKPFFREFFASSSFDDFVHSPSVTQLPNGGLMAVWFAGSREGAPDVDIRGARFDPVRQEWSPEFTLVSRESTQAALKRHIRKLGNPVIALAPDGRLWLFYVSVSAGGWGGSAINATYSEDGGTIWSTPRRLVTSPFLNISTLVRTSPVFHRDGSIGLPVYHEFLGKFAEYLHLSPTGEVLDKFRISGGRYSLQPTVVPLSEDSALALLRNAGKSPGKLLASFTADRGETWVEPVQVEPWNPNSSLAAISEHNHEKEILVAMNNLQDGRHRLSLYETDPEIQRWRLLKILDESPHPDGKLLTPEEYRSFITEKVLPVNGERDRDRLHNFMRHLDHRVCDDALGCGFDYDYPNLIRSEDGVFHVVYSWNNAFIKHVTFNHAWLERQR